MLFLDGDSSLNWDTILCDLTLLMELLGLTIYAKGVNDDDIEEDYGDRGGELLRSIDNDGRDDDDCDGCDVDGDDDDDDGSGSSKGEHVI